MEEQRDNPKSRRTYTLIKSEVPPLTSIPINDNPEVLFQDAEDKDNLLGHLKGPGNWVVVFPVMQAVPDKEGANIMITPRNKASNEFITLDKLSVSELTTASEIILRFLEDSEGNRIVSSNRSPETRKWKPPSQSWKQFHLQFYELPRVLEKRVETRLPEKLREPFRQQLSEVVTEYGRDLIEAGGLSNDTSIITPGDTELSDIFITRGALVVHIENEDPEVLARLMKTMDDGYSEFHRKLFTCFVTNYDEVKDSGWEKGYVFRNQHEAKLLLKEKSEELSIDEYKRDRLLKLYKVLEKDGKEEVVEVDRRIYRSPSYVSSMVKTQNGIHFVFNSDMFRNTGTVEAVGLMGDRTINPEASLKERKNRARELVESLGISRK